MPWPSPSPTCSTGCPELAERGVCVLASGDPMLHGVGASLARRLPAGALTVIPHASAPALACARLGWAEAEVELVSVVGRPLELLHPALQPGRRVIVLVAGPAGPAEVAALLRARGYGPSRLVALEELGGPGERVREATAEDWGDAPAGAALHGRRGVPPGARRAAPAARPRPGRRGLRAPTASSPSGRSGRSPWPTSSRCPASCCGTSAPAAAASASSGCGPTRPAGRWPSSAGPTGSRASRATPARSACPDCGSSPARPRRRSATCEAPDAVFVGGGLTAPDLLERCWSALGPGGRLVANAVTLEGEALLARWYGERGGRPDPAGRRPRRAGGPVHRVAGADAGHPWSVRRDAGA